MNKAEEFVINYKPTLDSDFNFKKTVYGFEVALMMQIAEAYYQSRVNDVKEKAFIQGYIQREKEIDLDYDEDKAISYAVSLWKKWFKNKQLK